MEVDAGVADVAHLVVDRKVRVDDRRHFIHASLMTHKLKNSIGDLNSIFFRPFWDVLFKRTTH